MKIAGLIELVARVGTSLIPLGAVTGELLEGVIHIAASVKAPEHADGTPLSPEDTLQRVRAAFAPIADVKKTAEEERRK